MARWSRLLEAIAGRCWESAEVGQPLQSAVEKEYTVVLHNIERSFSIRGGDRLNQIFIEEQLQALELK